MKKETIILDLCVNNIAIPLMEMPASQVKGLIKTIYTPRGSEFVAHMSDKWESHDCDFFGFFLNQDQEGKRALLEYFGIAVSPEKYNDSTARNLAILFEKKKSYQVFPLETELLTQFCLLGNNNSLDYLKNIDPDGAWETVKKYNVDRYGNGKNWSNFWVLSDDRQKELITDYLLTL